MSEEIEAIERGPVEAMRAAGANELQVFFYGVLPQVRVAWTGIAIYTWDVAFRAATVVGFFGGRRIIRARLLPCRAGRVGPNAAAPRRRR